MIQLEGAMIQLGGTMIQLEGAGLQLGGRRDPGAGDAVIQVKDAVIQP